MLPLQFSNGLGVLAGHLVGGLLTRREASCHCHYSGEGTGVDERVLELLARQLDRCGPEELRGIPCPPCPASASGLGAAIAETGWVFALGVLVGAVGITLLNKLSRDAGPPSTGASVDKEYDASGVAVDGLVPRGRRARPAGADLPIGNFVLK